MNDRRALPVTSRQVLPGRVGNPCPIARPLGSALVRYMRKGRRDLQFRAAIRMNDDNCEVEVAGPCVELPSEFADIGVGTRIRLGGRALVVAERMAVGGGAKVHAERWPGEDGVLVGAAERGLDRPAFIRDAAKAAL